jgi:hypothetical protein
MRDRPSRGIAHSEGLSIVKDVLKALSQGTSKAGLLRTESSI